MDWYQPAVEQQPV